MSSWDDLKLASLAKKQERYIEHLEILQKNIKNLEKEKRMINARRDAEKYRKEHPKQGLDNLVWCSKQLGLNRSTRTPNGRRFYPNQLGFWDPFIKK